MGDRTIQGPIMVTGAASGIGFAICQALAAEQVKLILLDRDAAALARAVEALPIRTRPFVVDLLDAERVDATVEMAWSAVRSIAGLVNCAGIYPVTPLLEMSVEEWDTVLATNLRAPFLVTQALVKRMVKGNVGGAIVNITSTASNFCRPGIGHYGASKAGLSQLTRDMALEFAPHGIRVNAVAPGVIDTPKVRQHAAADGVAEHRAKLARVPLRRMGHAAEVASMVVTLLSDDAAYCTGSELLVDGGYTLGIPKY